jgi:hypothetical protein
MCKLPDEVHAARIAGLRYVLPKSRGIPRLRRGKNFYHSDTSGKRVSDPDTLNRIKALVIPPAWQSVWISPLANSDMQAVGRDARNRKQYRYHARVISRAWPGRETRQPARSRSKRRHDRAIALKSSYNIRVADLSVGRPSYESYSEDPLCQALEQAWKAGIAVVVAAGNDGRLNTFGNLSYSTINAPGDDPDVITVGAMNATQTDDIMASYSSKGPSVMDGVVKPDLIAPGNQIVSTIPRRNAQTGDPTELCDGYFTLCGTSISTLHFCGSASAKLCLRCQTKVYPQAGSSEVAILLLNRND